MSTPPSNADQACSAAKAYNTFLIVCISMCMSSLVLVLQNSQKTPNGKYTAFGWIIIACLCSLVCNLLKAVYSFFALSVGVCKK